MDTGKTQQAIDWCHANGQIYRMLVKCGGWIVIIPLRLVEEKN